MIDSTVYIDLLRARRDPVQALQPWLARDEVLSCGVIRCFDLAYALDRRGVVLPVTDLLIAVCAIYTGATIISADEHFRHVPDLAVLQSLPTS